MVDSPPRPRAHTRSGRGRQTMPVAHSGQSPRCKRRTVDNFTRSGHPRASCPQPRFPVLTPPGRHAIVDLDRPPIPGHNEPKTTNRRRSGGPVMTRHAHHHGTTDAPALPPRRHHRRPGQPRCPRRHRRLEHRRRHQRQAAPRGTAAHRGCSRHHTGARGSGGNGVSGVERTTPPRAEYACERGEFCLWTEQDYDGTIIRLDLRNTNPEECRPLPKGEGPRIRQPDRSARDRLSGQELLHRG